MKRSIPVFLSLLFLYSSCGFYLLQVARIHHCRLIFSSKRSSRNSKILILTPDSYKQTSADEIIFEGKMYDVIKKVVQGNKMIFQVVADEKEDHIIASIHEQIKSFCDSFMKKPGTPVKNIVKSIDKDFSSNAQKFSLFICSVTEHFPFIHAPAWKDYQMPSQSPPPWQG